MADSKGNTPESAGGRGKPRKTEKAKPDTAGGRGKKRTGQQAAVQVK